MQSRENKIKIINDLLNGKNIIIAESRPEIKFNHVSGNLYKEVVSDKVYTFEAIQALNEPYRELNNELIDWQETKEYEDREETCFGLPYIFQIHIKGKHQEQPDNIILPALELN